MIKTDATGQDFIELAEHKESLLGRDFVIRDLGMTHRGPISDVRVTTGRQLIITIDWRAAANADAWILTEPDAYRYGADLDKAVLRIASDDTVEIFVQRGWIGTILPASATPLEKPAR